MTHHYQTAFIFPSIFCLLLFFSGCPPLLQQIHRENKSLKKEKFNLQQQDYQLEADRKALQFSQKILKEQLTKNQSENEILSDSIHILHQDLKKWKQYASTLSDSLTIYQSAYSSAERERVELSDSWTEVHPKYNALILELKHTNEENKGLREELKDARTSEEIAWGKKLLLQDREQILETKYKGMKQEVQKAKNKVMTFKEAMQSLKIDLADKKIEVRTLRKSALITLPDKFLFPPASAALDKKALPLLFSLAKELKKFSNSKIEIIGYTDNLPIKSGRYASNWELSIARAASVLRELFRIAPSLRKFSITVGGAGANDPIATNLNSEGRRKNRRVEIKITNTKIGKLK